jgi:hypothetical protein
MEIPISATRALEMTTDPIQLLANVVVILGLPTTIYQLALSRWQQRTAFEDTLTTAYRDLLRDIPIDAMCGCVVDLDETSLRAFYRYFDLTNDELFLRRKGRVSASTWDEWVQGIKENMSLRAFHDAWAALNQDGRTFRELGRLIASDFTYDPGSRIRTLVRGLRVRPSRRVPAEV